MQDRKFQIAVLDEATQATEPEALVGFLLNVESAVLVGDGQQLPPTVLSKEAGVLGLNISLFERLEALGLTPHLLNIQYRMHPGIAEFPSRCFYKGKVKSGIKAIDRPMVKGVVWKNPQVGLNWIFYASCDPMNKHAQSPSLVSTASSIPLESMLSVCCKRN